MIARMAPRWGAASRGASMGLRRARRSAARVGAARIRVGLLLLLVAAASGSSVATASSRVTRPDAPELVPSDELDVRLVPDLVLTLGMFGVATLLDLTKTTWAGDLSCPDDPDRAPLEARPCDASEVNPVDRWATGIAVEGASTASDVLLAVSLLGPLGFAAADVAADRSRPGPERFGIDALVIAQTFAATYLVTTAFKIAVRRLRPFNYDPRFLEDRTAGDSRLSFPSGHSSMAFAGAATLSVLLDQRYPGEPWAIGLAGAGFLVATSVATFRVLAGRHFPTDVMVGATIGTTLGLLIPRFHRGAGPPSGEPTSAPVALAIGGRF